MNAGVVSVTTFLVDIQPDTCADLLEAATLRRLGVILDGRPEIYPVNHIYDRASGCVVFPTNDRTKLHAALNWPWVAFEVDGVDDGASGWSVLVVGRAEEITDPEEITRLTGQRDVLWRADSAVHWLRIVRGPA